MPYVINRRKISRMEQTAIDVLSSHRINPNMSFFLLSHETQEFIGNLAVQLGYRRKTEEEKSKSVVRAFWDKYINNGEWVIKRGIYNEPIIVRKEFVWEDDF